MASTDAKKSGPVIWVPLLACFFWLLLTLVLYRQAAQVDEAHRLELEHTRLSTVARQLMDARNWNAAHGGVYVLQSAYGKPNSWLPESERTLATEDGRTLVLMNPAYMSRQLAERNSQPGIGISIISNVPLRPENKADAWESGALAQCAGDAQEIFSAPGKDGRGKLRLLSVLVAQESCLRCHVGRQVGEVLGGISVSQDADAYLRNAGQQQRNMRLLYFLLGLTGVLAIGGLTLNLTRRRWLAEETSRMKSAFMARLSHDIRTPLTAILGMSELLQQKSMQEKDRKKALRYLTQAGSVLLEMVRDVTDHASLEQGALHLRPAPFALRAALESCTALFRPVAEAKGLDIDLDISPDLPDAVVGDSFRLRQALGNLVSNAVKFTELGRVRICVEPAAQKARGATPGAADALWLKIMVQDTGPGLPKEDAERIFESFQRGSDTPSVPGTGLGLNISRTIARRMGGDVTVISSPGQGSCFTLEVCLQLPRGTDPGQNHEHSGQYAQEPGAGQQGACSAQASLPPTLPSGPAPCPACSAQASFPAGGAFAGNRILVAEDNEANRYILEHMLRAEGASVHMARDGKSALAALHEGPWDMVILDARMPDMSGLDVLQAVRSGQVAVSPRQKVIIYTAALDAQDRQRCADLEADMVLLKPLSFASLRKELTSLLPEKQCRHMPPDCASAAGQALAEASGMPWGEKAPDAGPPRNGVKVCVSPAAPSSGFASASNFSPDSSSDFLQGEALMPWNRQEALAALDDDPELLMQLAEILRNDLKTREACLDETLTAGDAYNLRRQAHAIKNSAGTMRFDVLHARADAAEKTGEADLAKAVAHMRLALHEALATLDAYLEEERHTKMPPHTITEPGELTVNPGAPLADPNGLAVSAGTPAADQRCAPSAEPSDMALNPGGLPFDQRCAPAADQRCVSSADSDGLTFEPSSAAGGSGAPSVDQKCDPAPWGRKGDC